MKKQSVNRKCGLSGEVTCTVVGQNGEVRTKKVYKNLVVDTGLIAIADRLTNATPDNTLLITHIAVGTGTTAPAAGDTQLETEVDRAQQTSRTHEDKIAAAATLFAAGSIAGVPLTLKEAGLFIDSSATPDAATLLCRVAIDIAVGALDALFIDWRITVADA